MENKEMMIALEAPEMKMETYETAEEWYWADAEDYEDDYYISCHGELPAVVEEED